MRERVCVCVCALLLHFGFGAHEVRQQRIAVSVATFSFVSPMPIIIERTLVCLPLCLSASSTVCLLLCLSNCLSVPLPLSHNKKQYAKTGLTNISLCFFVYFDCCCFYLGSTNYIKYFVGSRQANLLVFLACF